MSTTLEEFKNLAETRLEEAKVLLEEEYYDGACYLSGYVIEFALKARICKVLNLKDYPDSGSISRSFKTHDFDDLVKLAGLKQELENKLDQKPKDFFTYWSLLTDWSVDFRYDPVGTNERQRAEEIIEALEDPDEGVFTWLKSKW